MRLIVLLLLLTVARSAAQTAPAPELEFIRAHVAVLTSPAMHGRGYVQEGCETASAFLQRKFAELGLQPVNNGSYMQGYTFPVNTFPGAMSLTVGGKTLQPGADYIIDARSRSLQGSLPVKDVDLAGIHKKKKLVKLVRKMDGSHAWLLRNLDSCMKALKMNRRDFLRSLPAGCYIVAETGKLTWTVLGDTVGSTIFYVKADVLPREVSHVEANVEARWIPAYKATNVVGCVPGEVKDSFVVVSAHYDHLGMMGRDAMFPGASDNASGTAMMLYLASWFSRHPQHYTMLFMAFSGEEIGLKGSSYFVAHPLVPLSNIEFLTNVDIMGDASDGVTVVNATEFPRQLKQLQDLNTAGNYLPAIKTRGKAANSDHYFFTEAGVPAFFIYSNGGKGHYHDIYDTASELTLNHIDGMARLMIDFLQGLQH